MTITGAEKPGNTMELQSIFGSTDGIQVPQWQTNHGLGQYM